MEDCMTDWGECDEGWSERIRDKKRECELNLFCNFVWNSHPPGLIPQREKDKSKIYQGHPQGELPQREERLRKTFFVFLNDWPSLRVGYTERGKTKRKKNYNCPYQNSLGYAKGELPQREERLRKNLFWAFIRTDLPPG